MLDDIECLGSIFPGDNHNQLSVSGVVLRVERSGEDAGYTLIFKRENTSVVQIGRRSGRDTDNAHNAPLTAAMFRCAVVSRRHAKIVFSDSGHAYIIDSGSHHGTHLRKLGDSCSKMLKPETSTLLNDGDIVTFGKAVGREDEWVKPIVAVVQLLYSSPSFKALTIPSPSSSEKSRSSSGRYGIHDSTSSEDSYSNSSDVEEIPPTESFSGQQEQAVTTTTVIPELKPVDPYSAFKRFISPAIRSLPSVSEIIGDRGVGLLDVASKSLPTIPDFTAPIRRQDDANAPGLYAGGPETLELRLDCPSSSPVELKTPSPPIEVQVPVARQLSIPLLTPVVESLGPLVPIFDLFPVDPPTGISLAPSLPEATLSPLIDSDDSCPESSMKPVSVPAPTQNGMMESNVSTTSEITEIHQTLKRLNSTVASLHSARRKHKTRFNTNVSFISNKLSEIDDKFAEVDAEYNVLCDQVEELQHGDFPDLARQLEELSDRVDAIVADMDDNKFKTPEGQSPAQMPIDDAKVSVKVLHDLADEMRALHVKSQEEFSHHLNDLRSAREEAMEVIEEAKAIVASIDVTNKATKNYLPEIQAPVPTSLKRKRDDMDEDEDAAAVEQAESAFTMENANAELAGEMDIMDILDQPDFLAIDIESPLNVGPPPRKRIRKFGSVVVLTAVTSAVITWSALAFS